MQHSGTVRVKLALTLALCGLLSGARALENGLARTPPMGWLAWERYVCETDCAQNPGECLDFQLFQDMATRLAEDGYKQLAYHYVNIDDCWSLRRRHEANRQLVADPARFPHSIKPLADHVHALGLKLGIYGDCGTQTCQGFPGQLKFNDSLSDNFYQLDAQLFASWHIDSFKFDGCSLDVGHAARLCPPMGLALNATQRPILFSCSWPAYENDENLPTDWQLVADTCNLWRAFGDIEDSWRSVLDTIDWFVKKQALVVRFHGPGHWFDADQLVIGDFGLSHSQEQAHMAVWCVWASPLYMSNDLRRISKHSQRILRNKWAIAVNQDPLGVFGLMVGQRGSELQAFVKPIEPLEPASGCPSYAIVYLDRRTLGNSRAASFPLAELLRRLHSMLAAAGVGAPQWAACANATRTFGVFDVFDNNAKIIDRLDSANGQLRLRVDPSGARFVTLFAAEPATA